MSTKKMHEHEEGQDEQKPPAVVHHVTIGDEVASGKITPEARSKLLDFWRERSTSVPLSVNVRL